MSKGTQRVVVRISPPLMRRVQAAIAARELSPIAPPLTISVIVREGLEEWLDVRERRKKAAAKKRAGKRTQKEKVTP